MKKERTIPEINAGSMADIAFLLLVFFLVATTIKSDKGLQVLLPAWTNDNIIAPHVNVLSVNVNADNQLLVEGESFELKDLRAKTKEYILNPNRKKGFATSPKKAIVSFKSDRGTDYKTYLNVYNELRGAYNELRDDLSMKLYKVKYEALDNKTEEGLLKRKKIRDEFPMVISEAETAFGEKLNE